MTEQVGFVGLGAMGIGMTPLLQTYLTKQNEKPLIFTNRSMEKGKAIVEMGAKPATLEELVEKCTIIFFMLANDEAVTENFKKALAVPNVAGKLFVDCSTNHPDTGDVLVKMTSEAKVDYVASPVFGTASVAALGNLVFVPAGKKELVSRITPYVQGVMGRAIFYLGEEQKTALKFKITGNVFILGLVELVGETQVFGETQGIDAHTMTDWAGVLFGPVLQLYFKKNATGVYLPKPTDPPGFSVDNALKDARHAFNMAKETNAPLPILQVSTENMKKAVEIQGTSHLDVSCGYGTLRTRAGLDFENEAVKQRDEKK